MGKTRPDGFSTTSSVLKALHHLFHEVWNFDPARGSKNTAAEVRGVVFLHCPDQSPEFVCVDSLGDVHDISGSAFSENSGAPADHQSPCSGDGHLQFFHSWDAFFFDEAVISLFLSRNHVVVLIEFPRSPVNSVALLQEATTGDPQLARVFAHQTHEFA